MYGQDSKMILGYLEFFFIADPFFNFKLFHVFFVNPHK